MKLSDAKKRNSLRDKKPLVFDKVSKFNEKLKKGESIAIIQLQYNYACNLNCKHCCTRRFQQEGKGRKLTPEDVKDIFDQADEMGLARVTITGGEPTIFPDFDELVAAIGPDRFWINCDTNGVLFDKKMAKHFKEIGVDRIQLSLDRLDPGQFSLHHGQAIEAVDYALDAGLAVFIQTMVTHKRIRTEELKVFIKHFNDKGVSVYCNYPKPVGAFEGQFEALVTKGDMDYMVNELEANYKCFTHLTPGYGVNLGCISVKGMISITAFGDVMPCPWIPISLGNIFEEPLKDIVKRGLSIKYFGEWCKTCLAGEDRKFIEKYITKTYGKKLPVLWRDLFPYEDRTKKPFNESKKLFR